MASLLWNGSSPVSERSGYVILRPHPPWRPPRRFAAPGLRAGGGLLVTAGLLDERCGCQNRFGSHVGVGAPILEPILVVGFGCSLGVRFGC